MVNITQGSGSTFNYISFVVISSLKSVMELSIECKTRPESSKPKALRREGRIPASLYGHKGAESLALTVDQKDMEMLLRKVSINKTQIQINIADQSWSGKAVLKEVQAHPAKGDLYHISFCSVAD